MDETFGDVLARTNVPNIKTGIAILDEVSTGMHDVWLTREIYVLFQRN